MVSKTDSEKTYSARIWPRPDNASDGHRPKANPDYRWQWARALGEKSNPFKIRPCEAIDTFVLNISS